MWDETLSPVDMDVINLRAAAREIALVFGVPPMLLRQPADSIFANFSEANRALWRLAIELDSMPALALDGQALWLPAPNS